MHYLTFLVSKEKHYTFFVPKTPLLLSSFKRSTLDYFEDGFLFNRSRNKIGIMGYDYNDGSNDDSFSSDISSVASLDDDSDDVFEECDSSSLNRGNALENMSDLLQQLPSKKSGLSKYFQGKSQSFTSLSKVMCLEDLAKPENPFNKKLKSCKSYVGLSRVVSSPTQSASSSKLFAKRMSSGTSSSLPRNSSCRLATCLSFIS